MYKMEEIEKKKYKKWKIILGAFILAIIILVSISAIGYYNYKEENSIKNQLEETYEQSLEKVKSPDPSIKNPLTDVNPRWSFLNISGDEVAFISHEGNIQGIGNLTFTDASEGYGFFKYLGASFDKVGIGWFTELFADNINATTSNATEFYEKGSRLALNVSLGDYIPLIQNASYLSTYNETYDELILDNSSLYSTYNATYDAKANVDTSAYINCSDDEVFLGNGSCESTSVYKVLNGDNSSWNQSYADDLYVNIIGDTMIGNLTIDTNLSVGDVITSKDINVIGTGTFKDLIVDTDTLVVDAANVGIRTASPGSILNVGSSTSVNPTIRLTGSIAGGSDTYSYAFGFNTQGTTYAALQMDYSTRTTVGLHLRGINYPVTISPAINHNLILDVTGTGNVGIGTATPDGKLHVFAGNSGVTPHASANLVIENDGTNLLQFIAPNTTTQGIMFGDTEDDGYSGYIRYSHVDDDMSLWANSVKIMTLKNSNVGIGNANPATSLEVGSGIGTKIITINSFGNSALDLYTANETQHAYVQNIAGRFRVYIGGEFLTVLNTGNVGIGTASPTYPLEVVGNVSGVSIWSDGNVSASGYITRTSVFDKSKNPFDYIKDADYYLTDGKIDHKKFYGYAGEFEITDYSRPEIEKYIGKKCEENITGIYNQTSEVCNIIEDKIVCNNVTEFYNQTEQINCIKVIKERVIYPYNKLEKGIELGKEVDVLRQGIYILNQENQMLKDCITNSNDFTELKLCVGSSK